MGTKVSVTAEEIEEANKVMHEFEAALEDRCSKIRLLGLMVGIPNAEGAYGVLAIKSDKVSEADFVRVFNEVGIWMGKMNVQ
jgi:citrate lyase beta subunit